MSSHAPGPWKVVQVGNFYHLIQDQKGQVIAIISTVGMQHGRANVHLVAAAPMLLEALEEILEARTLIGCSDLAERAIQAAKGNYRLANKEK